MRLKFLACTILLLCTCCRLMASVLSDTVLIKQHLIVITKTENFRTHENVDQLNKTAAYIKGVFTLYADTVYEQHFIVNGKTYQNIICSFGTQNAKRIVVGAHYDVCEEQEGADDNASGVVGLLELARLLKNKSLKTQIDLVAYTLEEPPYFRTAYMGSYIHAKWLYDNNVNVLGMVSLEMIGYFKDKPKTQSYPIGALSVVYGNKGNYITLVKKFAAGNFTRKFCKHFKSTKSIRTKKFSGPMILPGIDFSDHLNYWNFGYSALMVTDTAFYRNKNYHQSTDTLETLDIYRMSKVIDGVFNTLGSF